MTSRRTASHSAVIAVACLLVARTGSTQDATAHDAAVRHFLQNVGAYVALRNQVVETLPQPAVTADPATLEQTTDRLAHAIQAARPHVQRGNVFSDDVARSFRNAIAVTLGQHGIAPADVLASVREEVAEGRDSGERQELRVDARFKWGSGSAMPAAILTALPALPKPLEYTLVHRSLLIVDVDADLVVDVLADAVPTR
jgi:hypothetical protein